MPANALPFPAACVALLAFAVEEGNGGALIWLASRQSLIASTFTVLALGLHLKARPGDARARVLGSAGAFVVGLLSTEYALTMLGYFGAFALLEQRGRRWAHLRRLAPLALIVGAYLGFHSAMGYGVHNFGLYVDPRHEPLRALSASSEQYLHLLSTLTIGMDIPYGSVLAAGLLVAVAVVVRETRPWLLGAVVSLIPCSFLVDPDSSRQLVVPAIGVSAAVGLVVFRGFSALRSATAPLAARIIAGVAVAACLGIHVVLSAVSAYSADTGLIEFNARRSSAALEADLDDAAVPGQRVVFLSTRNPSDIRDLFLTRRFYGHPIPRSYLALGTSPARKPRSIKRVSERELEIASAEPFYRDDRSIIVPVRRLAVGEKGRVSGVEITVLARNNVGPTTLRLALDEPVDDEHWRFLVGTARGYRRFALPAVGETATTTN